MSIFGLAAAEAAPLANRGNPGLATALAWFGIVIVIGGLATIYARQGDGRAERLGFTIACIGALICISSLVVAP